MARFLPFLRRDVSITVVSGTGTGSLGVAVTLTGSGRVWHPTAPIAERIEALRKHISEIEGRLNEVTQELRQETSERERVVAEIGVKLNAEMIELRHLMSKQERQSARIDARGLPVIAFGVVLSGVPDELASIPYGIGWLAPALGFAAAMAAGVPAWREAHRAGP